MDENKVVALAAVVVEAKVAYERARKDMLLKATLLRDADRVTDDLQRKYVNARNALLAEVSGETDIWTIDEMNAKALIAQER